MKTLKKVFVIVLLVSIIINSNLMVVNAAISHTDILNYKNRVDGLNDNFVSELPKINTYLTDHKNALEEIFDKDLLISVIEKFQDNQFSDSIDLVIDKLTGSAKIDLQSLKLDLIPLMNQTKELESDLRIYINNNINEISFTDLFPITEALNSLYQTNKNNIKSVGSHIKDIFKSKLSVSWDDFEEYEITEFINNIFTFADDIKNNLPIYQNFDSKLNSWINIINDLELEEIIWISNLRSDFDRLNNSVKDNYEQKLAGYFEALNARLVIIVNAILNSEDTIINKNTRISDIIDIYDEEIERINAKYTEALTYTEVIKIKNIVREFKTILLDKMNNTISYLMSKLQPTEIDIINVKDNDLDNIIDYNEDYFVTKNLYTLTNINTVIKMNTNNGYILYSNLQNSKIATNSNMNIYNNDDQLIKTYKVIVKGDVVANGIFNVNDVRLINAHILRQETLTNIYYESADLTDDGLINVNDARMLNQKIIDGA